VSWPYNTITDGENVTHEALGNILGIWDYLKNGGDHPESANMGNVSTLPSRAVQGPVGGRRSEFARPSARTVRTPMGAYVWSS
jgi:hypothetical protein